MERWKVEKKIFALAGERGATGDFQSQQPFRFLRSTCGWRVTDRVTAAMILRFGGEFSHIPMDS